MRIDIADCENSVRFAHHGRRGVARRYLTKNTVTFHALRLSLNACRCVSLRTGVHLKQAQGGASCAIWANEISERSEEHTSELQSRGHLVCRLLLEKKK